MRVCVFFLLCFLVMQRLPAQPLNPDGLVRYTTAEGLSHNAVTGLAQDKTGYVWVSTVMGLNRFNGARFVQYHSTDDNRSLPAEELTNLSWLQGNRLAVWTGAGLHIRNTQTGEAENLFVPYHRRQYLYKFNTTHGVQADGKGNLYLLTRSGFYHFLHRNLVWRFDYYGEADLDNTHFHFGGELYDYDEHRLLLSTSAGLYVYDKQKRELKKVSAAAHPVLAAYVGYTNNTLVIRQYKPGQFFVLKRENDTVTYLNIAAGKIVHSKLAAPASSTSFHYRTRLFVASDTLCYLTDHTAGFYRLRFNPKTGGAVMDAQKSFGAYLCTAMLHDREGRLWVGTNKGLFREDPQATAVTVYRPPQTVIDSFAALRFSAVYSVGGKLFAGARGDAGVLVFNSHSGAFERHLLFDKKGSGGNGVSAMALAGKDELLVGTSALPYLFNTRMQSWRSLVPPNWDLKNDWTADVYTDRSGSSWVSAGHRLYRYLNNGRWSQSTAPPPLNIPVALKEDRQGNVWMGSHGLARLNVETGRYDIVLDSFPALKMPDRQIAAFAFDGENNLWLSCANNGLLCYDVRRKTFRQFSTRNGLPDNDVLDILCIGSRLWLLCSSGLASLQLPGGEVTVFGKEDGFPAQPVYKGARLFYNEAAQRLYVPFATAVASFSPNAVLAQRVAPQVFIEALVLGGEAPHYLPGTKLSTPFSRNEAAFTIGTVGFASTETARFAYRIFKGEETPWIELGSQPSFSVAGLLPGTHRIQVKAFSTTNRWLPQRSEFALEVIPPFWLETWFLLLMSVGMLALIYCFSKWRIVVAQRKEMVKTQMEKLKAENYKAQYELEQISHYFSSSLSDKKTEEAVLWDVAENLIGRLNYEDCIIYLWNETKTKMVQKAAYGPKGRPEIIAADAFTVAPGQGIVGEVIQTRKPVLVTDTRRDIRYRVDDEFRLSEVAVPILHNGELLGVIDSEHSRLKYFSERDIKILTTIGTLIGNKLKHLESEQSLAEQQKELAGINEQLAEAKLSALQAQMNPHFVFNALNSIKRMILDDDNEKASRYLSKFALMIRMTLEHSKETFVTLQENVDYIKAYLDMERLRFGDSFAYKLVVDEAIDANEATVPSMMIQPLVENAIWHGLMQSGTDKRLSILFQEDEGKLVCVVEDNGIGIRQAQKQKKAANGAHRSVGLENLRRRIKIMNDKYDLGCSLSLTDLSDADAARQGTRVVLQLNLMTV